MWFDQLWVRGIVRLFSVATWFQWLVIIFVGLELLMAGAEVAEWAGRHWIISAPVALAAIALIWWRVGRRKTPEDPPRPWPDQVALTAIWSAGAFGAVVAAFYILRLAVQHPDYSVPFAILVVILGIIIAVMMLREPKEAPAAEPEPAPTARARRKRGPRKPKPDAA